MNTEDLATHARRSINRLTNNVLGEQEIQTEAIEALWEIALQLAKIAESDALKPK